MKSDEVHVKTEYFLYLAMLSGCSLIAAVILLLVWFFACGFLGGFDNKKDGSLKNWPFAVMFSLAPLVAPLAFAALSNFFSVLPPAPKSESQEMLSGTDRAIAELEHKATKLRTLLLNPKNLTLSQVDDVLADTLDFSEKLRVTLSEREQAIKYLRQELTLEKARADESMKLAREVQSLTKSQLEAVKLLITQDAKQASSRSFILGTAISFPLGIISSLMASWLFRRFGEKTQMHLQSLSTKMQAETE